MQQGFHSSRILVILITLDHLDLLNSNNNGLRDNNNAQQ